MAFCCSISISMTSFSVVSLIAMVPESECRMPTLIGAGALRDGGRRQRGLDAADGSNRYGSGAEPAELTAGEPGVL